MTLAELARLAGLSAFHLCRVFRQSVGMPPHAYQTQLRVRQAKALLRAGQPIVSAAIAAGFYDQAHLTRHFKRIVGVPPGRYLESSTASHADRERWGSCPMRQPAAERHSQAGKPTRPVRPAPR